MIPSLPRHRRSAVALAVILAVQIALSLRLIWSNAPFPDEALYIWAGRVELSTLLHGNVPGQGFPSYFSGAPVIYPPLAAVANDLGGLAGARLLSLCFILGATTLLYFSVLRLLDLTAAVSAALVFAFLGSTQFLSAFATYDAMAIFLMALATWLVVLSSQDSLADYRELLAVAAGITLAGADATKYATTLWDPVVFGLMAVLASNDGWRATVWSTVRLMAYTAVAVGVALLAGGGQYIDGIQYTTTDRLAGTTPAADIVRECATWLWPVLLLSLVALVMLVISSTMRTRLLVCLMIVAVFLAPIHAVQTNTDVSLYKHVAFGAWFGSIACGYAISSVAGHFRQSRWMAALASLGFAVVAAMILGNGISQVDEHYTAGWSNLTQVGADLDSLLPQDGCPCFAMSNVTADYYALGKIPTAEDGFVGPWYFQYKNLSGTPAYVAAIRNGYFHVVEVDPFNSDPQLVSALNQTLASNPAYRLAYRVSVPGGGVADIWEHAGLLFDDEFSGPAGSSPGSQWRDVVSGPLNGESESYADSRSNSYLNGTGQLVVAATRDDGGYQSARLASKVTFSEGETIEARIKLSPETGFWPAWWLLGAGDRQEVDMMENYGQGFAQTTVWNSDNGKMLNKASDVSVGSGWHTYEVQWTKAGFTFYLDGRKYMTVTPGDLKGWGYTGGKTMDMILNVAVGGIAGRPSPSAHTPVTMEVDWVRAWKDGT